MDANRLNTDAKAGASEATQHLRIDKWLWAVRVYKTRTLAAEACRGGHVKIGGDAVKASREIHISETIDARAGVVNRTVKVLGLIERRVGAAAVKAFMEDLTPPEEYQKARAAAMQPVFTRPRGAGRPTKKDRRDIEKLL
jgi:ribosome-associated heat shock protein Hsp15